MHKLRSLYKDLELVTNTKRKSRFGKSYKFGVEEKMTDSRKIFLGAAGAGITAHVGINMYKRKMNNKIHDKINILEDKFIKCNIPFKKIEKKNFLSKSSYTDQNIEKRILNLENALKNSHFGNDNLTTSEIDKTHRILSGVIVGGTVLGGGVSMFMFKREMKKYIKRLDVIEKELQSICKNK